MPLAGLADLVPWTAGKVRSVFEFATRSLKLRAYKGAWDLPCCR